MNEPVDLSIVIVSYNTLDYLRKCLESIYQYTKGINYEVIVIDNASTDGSAEMVQKTFPQVILHALKDNLGFTRGNNIGIQSSKGEYVLILNPDTEIRDNVFVKLIGFLKQTPSAVGVICKLRGYDGKVQRVAGRFPTIFSSWLSYSTMMILPKAIRLNTIDVNTDITRPVDWIVGAAMMIRGIPLRAVGGFDERIFMFAEDVDLCLRLHKKTGLTFYYYPGETIIHAGGASYSRNNLAVTRYGFRSSCYYLNKHYGPRLASIFKNAVRFSWTVTLMLLFVANILTLGQVLPLSKKTKFYIDILSIKADCQSGKS